MLFGAQYRNFNLKLVFVYNIWIKIQFEPKSFNSIERIRGELKRVLVGVIITLNYSHLFFFLSNSIEIIYMTATHNPNSTHLLTTTHFLYFFLPPLKSKNSSNILTLMRFNICNFIIFNYVHWSLGHRLRIRVLLDAVIDP